jgi:hypothetical protein
MDFTVYLDRFIFPVALFFLIFSSFYLESYLSKSNYSSLDNKADNHHSELEQFYEFVGRDNNLLSQLDSILENENYLEQIVKLGNSLNYNFTTSDLYQSITKYTANSNSNYICLPLGCWRISV